MNGSEVPRIGGRPAVVNVDDIVRAGRALGMRRLSLKAVATKLGVSSTALYRHVDGRWELERLVGESLLGELELHDEPEHDTSRHLLSFAMQLREFILQHSGLATYLQTLFPRGTAGRHLLATEVEALGRRGYQADAAIVLCGAVASLTIGFAAAEEIQQEHSSGIDTQRDHVEKGLLTDPVLSAPHRVLPTVTAPDYARLVLTAAIRGLVDVGPAGRPVEEIIAELTTAGEDV